MGRRKVSFDFLLLALTSLHTQEGGGAAWEGGGQYGKEKSQFRFFAACFHSSTHTGRRRVSMVKRLVTL